MSGHVWFKAGDNKWECGHCGTVRKRSYRQCYSGMSFPEGPFIYYLKDSKSRLDIIPTCGEITETSGLAPPINQEGR